MYLAPGEVKGISSRGCIQTTSVGLVRSTCRIRSSPRPPRHRHQFVVVTIELGHLNE